MRRFAVFLAGIVSLCALGSQSSFAAVANYTDPAGYPAAWPAALATQAYTAQGNSQNDLEGNPDNSKGATPQSSADFSSGSGSQPSCYYYADGSILFFRVRLSSSPMALSGSGEPFVSATWNFLIDTDGDGWKEFVIEVDGTSSTSDPDDIVVIYDNANSQKFTIGLANVWYQDTGRHPTNRSGDGADGEPGSSSNWDADSNAYIWDFGRTRVVQLDTSKAPNSNNSEYFLDVQVPLAALDASGLGGPTMTANTPFLMAITTSNSNTDPTQKDIIFSGDFAMSDVPFPTGDPTTPSGQILQAPVVTSVTASACPSPIVLNATVMDALTVEGGVTVDTISNVVFQYWFDADGNGSTNEASSWVTIGTANTTNVLSQFTLTWNTTSLAQGQYFIRVVATDNQGNTTISTSQSLYPSGIYATFNNTCGSLIGDLAAFKTGATNVFATSNLTYTITVTNLGPTQATNVVVNDTLPAGVSFVSASGGGTNNAGVVGWPTISSFAVFATTNFTVTVTAPNSGTLTNRASVTAATSDSSTNNNTSSVITTVIPLADLLTTKTGATNILAGSNFTYTITVINLGPSTATNVMVSDTLPAGVTFVSASAGGTNSAGVVGWPAIATFVNGATTNFTVTVTAPAGGTLTNIAASTSSISDPSTNNNSSAVITAVTPQSDVTINKTGPANPDAASNFTYTITVTNLGPSTATDIAVSDTLPATVTFVSASGGGTNSGGVVGWPTIASLASGATTNFTLTVTAPASGGLTNLASVVTGTGDPSTNNNTSTFINTVAELADIAVTKTGSTNVLAATNFTYTITVTNLGPSTAINVAVSDTLPAGVTFISASAGGTNNAGVIGWPAIASFVNGATTNFTVTVMAPASGTLTNVASATSSTTDTATNNNASAVITTVTPQADVATTKTGPASVLATSNITYTITVTNLGPSAANSVSVSDTLPAGVTFVSASAGGTNNAGIVGWPVIANLASGATTNFTVTVTAPAGGTLTNVASATSSTTDTATNNNSSAVITAVTPQADVTINKTGPANPDAASNFTYTITVTNLGPSTATDIAVSDTLPATVTFVSASGGGTNSGGVVGWPTIASLASGATTNFTLTVTAPASGGLTNLASVVTGTGDLSTNNNTSTFINTVSEIADIAITKTGPTNVLATANFSYTITVTNLGPSTASNVSVSDTLPAGVTFVSATGGGTNDAGVVGWPVVASFANGAMTNFTVTVTAPASGTLTNVASSTSATTDPSAGNNSSSFITTVTPVADVATTKSGPASVAGNGLVTYTITVTNLGPSTASNVSVTDTLPAGVTFVSASGGGTNSAGVVGWPVITSLANGATTSFTVTVTAPGSGTLTNVVSSTATTLDPEATNNDGSAAGAIVVTFITGVNVSGTVYSDVNHNAQLDSGETGTGLSLFTKLIPTASPTSAVVVAAVNSATGAYTLTNVASGNYILIVDDNNSAADVTPTIPSGWVGTEVPNQTRVNVVVNSADVPNQNFGLFGGGTVSGVVFEDNGAGGGTANDGVQNGSEAGIAGVTVKVTDNSGATVYDTATTDGAGTYTVFTPGVSATLKIVETNLTGYVSTGAGVGTTGGSYNRPTDTVTFSNVAGTSYSGVNFGDVPTNLFAPDHQQSALPGATVVYAHTFVAGSVGQVTFTTLRAATPNIPGWNEVLYLDANCDALLDAADTPITAAIAMTTGQKVCILVKEFVPASAPFGAQDVVTVTASFDYTGATPSLTVASTRTDVTTVGDLGTAGLTLVKNADKASALPGEVLTYTIEYHNASGGSLTNIFIHDMTPAFTTFVAATNAPVPLNLTGVTITAPSVGASGPIVWQFTGSLAPNTGGSVRFQVKIEE